MKRILGTLALLVMVILVGGHVYSQSLVDNEAVIYEETSTTTLAYTQSKIIGRSVNGNDIEAYAFGTGDAHLLFVGGIHGGYEWNTVLLAEEFIKYFQTNPASVPFGVTVTIIPVLNPDGVAKKGESAGRFNGNNVDLNRNFDCKWQEKSVWRNQEVNAGTQPFSEPEAIALRDFVFEHKPDGVVFWHSQSNAVYASECEEGVLPKTVELLHLYADASGYPKQLSFDAYPVTGDAEGWLASMGIPALTVELSTHEVIEWEKNLAGVSALMRYYSND